MEGFRVRLVLAGSNQTPEQITSYFPNIATNLPSTVKRRATVTEVCPEFIGPCTEPEPAIAIPRSERALPELRLPARVSRGPGLGCQLPCPRRGAAVWGANRPPLLLPELCTSGVIWGEFLHPTLLFFIRVSRKIK